MVKRAAPKASPAKVKIISDSATDRPQSDNQISGRSALARRVGRAKASSDIAAFQKKVIGRNCMVRVIDKMVECPDSSVSIWAAIESKTIAGLAAADKEAQSKVWFDARDNRLSCLPADWSAVWILSETGASLKQTTLDQMDGANPEILSFLASWATACPLNQTLPPECRHKQTCSRCLTQRHTAVGDRSKNLAAAVTDAGGVDWMKLCPIQVALESGEDPIARGLALRRSEGAPWLHLGDDRLHARGALVGHGLQVGAGHCHLPLEPILQFWRGPARRALRPQRRPDQLDGEDHRRHLARGGDEGVARRPRRIGGVGCAPAELAAEAQEVFGECSQSACRCQEGALRLEVELRLRQ